MKNGIKSSTLAAVCVAIAYGAYFLFGGFALEEQLGLKALFRIRGPITPPEQVAIVAMEKSSADALGLRNDPGQWPREIHAELIRNLKKQGARLVVFDVHFRGPKSREGDLALADAIAEAGNVLLYGFLKRDILVSDPQGIHSHPVSLERLEPPLESFASAALAVAPFPLPKVPVSVSQFWTFRPEAGDMPTLPAVALQLQFPALLSEIRSAAGFQYGEDSISPLDLSQKDVVMDIRVVREKLRGRADFVQGVGNDRRASAGDADNAAFDALSALYTKGERRYLNFYGPPQSVKTIPYIKALRAEDAAYPDVRGKVVFVGFSESLQPEQKDNHYTVFSRPDGLDLSGIEIMTTAYANLLRDETIRPLSPLPFLLLIGLFGVGVSVLFKGMRPVIGIPCGLLFAAGYSYLCLMFFSRENLWLPAAVPLLVQLPFALFGSLIWHYFDVSHERRRIRHAFSRYLPEHVVTRLAREKLGGAHKEAVFGVCLFSDIAGYTPFAEALKPDELADRLNRYYGLIFPPVRARGGSISDVIGDAMLAIWSSAQRDSVQCGQACAAGLEIDQQLMRNSETSGLPTRIGMHAGDIVLGDVGAGDHYEYRPIGDIVNAASRIQGLNKELGTRILASVICVEGVNDFLLRSLGKFRLRGKRDAVDIVEIVAKMAEASPEQCELVDSFREALGFYEIGNIANAARCFGEILVRHPSDGPSAFYLRLCCGLIETPREGIFDPVVQAA